MQDREKNKLMDTDSNMTAAQKSYLDGQYGLFYTALSTQDYVSAEKIIAEVQANEFEKVVEDMKKLLAQKKLNHA